MRSDKGAYDGTKEETLGGTDFDIWWSGLSDEQRLAVVHSGKSRSQIEEALQERDCARKATASSLSGGKTLLPEGSTPTNGVEEILTEPFLNTN